VQRLRLAGVLALPAHPAQHEVAGARRDLLSPEELLCAPADRQLAYRALAAMEDGGRERLGLVDGRHRLRLLADLLTIALELRRVDRSGKDDGDGDVPVRLLNLDARRLEERTQGGLRRAVPALQRDAAIRERGVHRDERAAG